MKEQKSNGNESISLEASELKQLDSYWTDERMEKAIPLPSPKISKEELDRLKEKFKANGIIESVEGYNAELESVAGTPEKANVKERPFWNGGKLYFTKPDGKDYVGSAEFCGDAHIVLTAAHCIRDNKTGEWYKNVVFKRAYDNGGGQKVEIKILTSKSAWHNGSGDKPYEVDYSFLVAKTKSGAGWLGWKTSIPYSNWTSIGYPKNYGKTKYMQKVTGSKGKVSGGVVEMLDNAMNGGSSGGAWIGDLTTSPVGGNYAIGLNSFHYDAAPGNEWSPLFDDKFSNLYYYALGLK